MGHVRDLGLYPKQWEATDREQRSELVRSVFPKVPAGCSVEDGPGVQSRCWGGVGVLGSEQWDL